ncbi:MAG: class I adenylate-forming enzyme family protein [Chthoniobacterales bacterium]
MTLDPDAILHRWNRVLEQRGACAAIYDTRGNVLRTFAGIEDEARELAETELANIRAGQVVAIQVGNHPAWPALLLGCLRRGLVALPLERSISANEREIALATCGAAAVVSTSNDGVVAIETRAAAVINWDEHQPVLLKLTSGTTAAPRAIRFQSAQLLADCDQICDTMGIGENDVNFAVIPASHSYGFSNLITPLIARGVPMVLSSDRMPRAVLDDLNRTNATVFPGMPVFYQAFCELDAVPDLPHLRLCISAGAPLLLSVAQRFRDKFGKPIHSFYGSSECGGICYDREAALVEPGFVGQPMNGVQLELLDEDPGATRVCVQSAAAADGYFPLSDVAKLGLGAFAPDDLLAERAGGFAIVGRTSDIINVAGKKVNPAEVEATLLAFSGVRDAAVFGLRSSLRNEEVAACIVASTTVTEAVLLEFCRSRLSGWQVPKRLFFLAAMPVNERGKISRRALAERFAL